MSESEFEEAAEVAHDLIKERSAESKERHPWTTRLAMSTMVMALLSAIGALLAGMTANEALFQRTQEIMEMADKDRDEIELTILRSKNEVLRALRRATPEADASGQLQSLSEGVDDLTRERQKDEAEVGRTVQAHEYFAFGVTLLSIAITLSGMAIIAERRHIWYAGLGLGVAGGTIVIFAFVLAMVS